MSILSLLCCLLLSLTGLVSADGGGYDDWSWATSIAAVGDSFTAGIGAGRLWNSDSAECARYDQSYPAVILRWLGGSRAFQFPACSGDTSISILNQIDSLLGGVNLAFMSAGGNDLCLSNIIAQCVLSRFASESDCQSAISQARNGIQSLLQGNVRALLQELDQKMSANGIIVVTLYGEYFDPTTSACETENWGWPLGGLKLTSDHREIFNSLVRDANAEIKKAAQSGGWTNSRVVVADWSDWVYRTGGRFCEQGANPNPTDSSNQNLAFFKLDTSPVNLGDIPAGPLKIRSNISTETAFLEEIDAEMDFARARAAADVAPYKMMHHKRGLTAPSCPTGVLKNVVDYLLTDNIGKIFHPNKLGHEIIASFAVDAVRQARASILNIPGPGCVTDRLTCFADIDQGHYASAYAAYSSTADFCSSVTVPDNTANWGYTKKYYEGTLDEIDFSVQLSNGASTFDRDQCNKAVNGILDGCDKSSNNPMNWKQGGSWQIGSYKYTIQPRRENRLWPYLTVPKQSCEGWYKVVLDAYTIYGAGWATWDWGQQSLRPNSTSCFGLGITNWHFDYFDQPDSNGYEWRAIFNSPIWTRSRCYNNNKVQNAAGGGSDGGCRGNG